ncbi:hypothetical protein PMIN06_003083 [Paraphaeosphaeria minitans]
MNWTTSEDEADFSDSSVDGVELEIRSCGWHPKTLPPPPPVPPTVTDFTDAGKKMLRNAVALASSTKEWKKGVSRNQFTFAEKTPTASSAKAPGRRPSKAEQKIKLPADTAMSMGLNSAREVLQHCIERISKGTHPRFNDLRWNIDPFLRKSTSTTFPGSSLCRRFCAYSPSPTSERTASSPGPSSQVLLLVLLCAPKSKLVQVAGSAFDFDDPDCYERVVGDCLEKYAETFGQDLWRLGEIFGEVTALLHAQDVEEEKA